MIRGKKALKREVKLLGDGKENLSVDASGYIEFRTSGKIERPSFGV